MDDLFSEGSLSLKVHRHVYRGLSMAAGIEDLVQYGGWNSKSAYVVASQTLGLDGELLTGASATLGVGDGRFNTMERLSNGTNRADLFGGLSVRLVDRLNVPRERDGHVVRAGPKPRALGRRAGPDPRHDHAGLGQRAGHAHVRRPVRPERGDEPPTSLTSPCPVGHETSRRLLVEDVLTAVYP